MSYFNKVTRYAGVLAGGYEDLLDNLRATLRKPGTFKTDMFAEEGLRLWFNALDGWCSLVSFPPIEGTPTILFEIESATAKAAETFEVPHFDEGTTLVATDIIPLTQGATGTIPSSHVTFDPPSKGSVTVTLDKIAGLSAPAQYQGFVLARSKAGGTHLIATIIVLVSKL